MSGGGRSLFFFQAEDGIRDHCVTGVQTCALPISIFRLVGLVDITTIGKSLFTLIMGNEFLRLQPTGSVFSVVSENQVSTSTLEAHQRFHNYTLFVNPAVEGSCFNHGILARDIVGGNW